MIWIALLGSNVRRRKGEQRYKAGGKQKTPCKLFRHFHPPLLRVPSVRLCLRLRSWTVDHLEIDNGARLVVAQRERVRLVDESCAHAKCGAKPNAITTTIVTTDPPRNNESFINGPLIVSFPRESFPELPSTPSLTQNTMARSRPSQGRFHHQRQP